MFHVFYYQTPLLMHVMSIIFTSPWEIMNKSVVVVILKCLEYFIAPLVNLFLTSNALHYHKPHGTTNMNIPSLSVLLLKMTPVNITVISVKKNKILSNGFTIVRIAIFLLITVVFLGTHQMSSNIYNNHLLGDATH